jgi:lipoic acid synthetase
MSNTDPAPEAAASRGKPEYLRKPEWLRIQLSSGNAYAAVHRTLREGRLNTVCSEARCPNLHECWDRLRTATFMILGDTCTRHCRFCAVKSGRPRRDGVWTGTLAVDRDEPRRVAEAAAALGLRHVVVTMVTRDDLADGGAAAVAATVAAIRKHCPGIGVELLVSDLGGNPDAVRAVVDSRPDILGHNLETVRRLTPEVRSRSTYEGSLAFLRCCRDLAAAREGQPAIRSKSSLMLGLGETREEVLAAMDDLRAAGVDMLNLGQYLQPGPSQLPVRKYWTPEEFAGLKREALVRGFARVEAGPLVRSSYHAAESAAGMGSPRADGAEC